MVPFFEKKTNFKKYLYRFDKSIIYTSEDKMKKDILTLINKNSLFQLEIRNIKKLFNTTMESQKELKKIM